MYRDKSASLISRLTGNFGLNLTSREICVIDEQSQIAKLFFLYIV